MMAPIEPSADNGGIPIRFFLTPDLMPDAQTMAQLEDLARTPGLDHYVAVLDVDDQCVTVGDPLNGKRTMTVAVFARQWRFVGVALRRSGKA